MSWAANSHTSPQANQFQSQTQLKRPAQETCSRDQQPSRQARLKRPAGPKTNTLQRPTAPKDQHNSRDTLARETTSKNYHHPHNTDPTSPQTHHKPDHSTDHQNTKPPKHTNQNRIQKHTTQTRPQKQTTAHTTKQRPKTTPPTPHHKLYWFYLGSTSALLQLGRSLAPDNPVTVHPQFPRLFGFWVPRAVGHTKVPGNFALWGTIN